MAEPTLYSLATASVQHYATTLLCKTVQSKQMQYKTMKYYTTQVLCKTMQTVAVQNSETLSDQYSEKQGDCTEMPVQRKTDAFKGSFGKVDDGTHTQML